MIEPTQVYSCAEVATEVFGITAESFRRRRRDLVAKDGFPRPISPRGRPRWFGRDILDWLGRCKIDMNAPDISDQMKTGKLADITDILARRGKSIAATTGAHRNRKA